MCCAFADVRSTGEPCLRCGRRYLTGVHVHGAYRVAMRCGDVRGGEAVDRADLYERVGVWQVGLRVAIYRALCDMSGLGPPLVMIRY